MHTDTYLLWEDLSNATTTDTNFPEQHANLSEVSPVPELIYKADSSVGS
jgi:hypothetical protein